MLIRKLAKALAVLVMLGWAVAWAQQTVLEVIQLKYRRVDEVIPVLQPLVPAQGSVSGLNPESTVLFRGGRAVGRVSFSSRFIPRQ